MKRSVAKIFFPVLIALFAFGNFTRIAGSENVRAIQIVSLITAGFGLGIAFANFIASRRKIPEKQP